MTTIPPPPTYPPAIRGRRQPPGAEWWAKGGPWSKPEPVDLRKTVPVEPADVVEDQAVEDQAVEVEDVVENQAEQAEQQNAPWGHRVHHNLHALISQTPEEQAANARRRREDQHREQGETEDEREARHERERRSAEHRASILWRQPQSERARRFRRWCVLTAASAVIGYNVGAIQFAAHLPLPVGVAALIGTWWIDLRLRGLNPRRDDRRGPVRVSEVRGAAALTVLVIARVPVASALVGVLSLAPLIALFSTHHH